MTADTLLTPAERKAIVERLVKRDAIEHEYTIKQLKKVRKIYNSWSDAELMSVRFD